MFSIINGVYKVIWPPERYSSDVVRAPAPARQKQIDWIHSDDGLTEISALESLYGGQITLFVDKSKHFLLSY